MANKIVSYIIITTSLLLLSISCTDEKPTIPTPDIQKANEWVYNTMSENYLWYDELPELSRLNTSGDTEEFFNGLLSPNDGKDSYNSDGVKTGHYYYSTIEKVSSTKAYMGDGLSYGFEFQYYYIQNLQKYALLILYVVKGSPAEIGGVERGDWIVEIDEQAVPNSGGKLLELLDTSTKTNIKLGINKKIGSAVLNTVSLSAAQITDSPVFLSKTITVSDRRKVGYLVYNHFTAGPVNNGQDETFNNELRKAFVEFKAQEPDEFILDLRYNGGGVVSSSQLLATMLAPNFAIGDVYCHLKYNDKKVENDKTLTLNKDVISSGANLNMKKLYVITSDRTASASEAVINGLRPYMDVVIVGEKTEGKNVGSVTYPAYNESNPYGWELHPIVLKITNKNGLVDDYPNGLDPTPTFNCDEVNATEYYDLGDEREYILERVLKYILDGTPVEDTKASLRSTTNQMDLKPIFSSLDRRRTNGVIID